MSDDEYNTMPTNIWSHITLAPPSRGDLLLWLIEDLCVIVARGVGLMALLIVLLWMMGHL